MAQTIAMLTATGIIPVLLALWLATGQYRQVSSATGWFSDYAAFASLMVIVILLLVITPFAFSSMHARYVIALLLVFGLIRFLFLRPRMEAHPATVMARVTQGITGALGIGALVALRFILPGLQAPEDHVELRFPLEGGQFVVGQGGGHPLINYHNTHTAQRYALDILALNPLGGRTHTFLPQGPEDYVVTGSAIVAPCDGKVAYARDGLPDALGAQSDRNTPAGNMVALQCGEVVVFLAHMQQGSVLVQTGDRVLAGAPLGKVGNSGNTTEPHLHIHAETGSYQGERSDNPGLAITFDGQFLVRNSTFLN